MTEQTKTIGGPWTRPDYLIAAGLLACTLFLYLWGIGSYSLWDPWEPKYAQAMREMSERGDMITPYFNDKIRWTKPIGFYWAMAIPMAIGGNDELTARLPSGLAAAGGVLILFYCVRRLRGRGTALMAAGVMATLPQYFYLARQAMPDMLFTMFLTGAMGFFALARFDGERRKLHCILFYASLALAVLTKGPLGGAIMVGTLVLFWTIQIDPRRLLSPPALLEDSRALWGHYHVGLGVVVFVAIAAPWYLAIIAKHGAGLFDNFIIDENIQRFSEPIRDHHGTSEYYFEDLLHGMYPWASLLPVSLICLFQGLKEFGEEARQRWYFASWFLCVFLLFTLAGTKLDHYLLPIAPALAVLVALAWEAYFREETPVWVAPAFLISIPFAIMPVRDFLVESDRHIFSVFTNARSIDHEGLDVALKLFIAAWILVILFAVIRKRSWVAAGLALAVVYGHAVYMSHTVLPAHTSQRTMLPYLESYEQAQEPDAELVFFGKIRYSMHYYYGKQRFRHFESSQADELVDYVRGKPHVYIIAQSSRLARLVNTLRASGNARWFQFAAGHPRYTMITNSVEAVKDR